MKVTQAQVRKAQKAAIYACIANGVDNANMVQKILSQLGKNFSHVSVAGCKAAITKGQKVPIF